MRSWLGRVDDAQRHLTRVNQLYLSTVSALSTAIEAKDGVTSDHIHRVQAYAMGLARALQ
jgi:response regulator RpfG family c-di-GMP phosphodiesterase